MSTVFVVTPIVIAHWPVIAAAITAAVSSMGYALAREGVEGVRRSQITETNRAEIEVENSEILADTAGTDEELVVVKDGIKATFNRDARGQLRVCMEGKGFSKSELKRIGEELIGRVTQQYVYHRVVTELKQRQMSIVHEEVAADRTVRIRVRNS